jgi:hypothetical protein
MILALSKRRFDEQLEAMLDDAAEWKVNGGQGVVLGNATSLRGALEKAMEIAARGQEVIALVHRSRPEVIIFASQLQRLANRIAEAEYCERGLQA